MPLTIRVKAAKMGNSLRMTIPVDVARALSFNHGDLLEVGIEGDKMTVKKVKVI